MFIFGDFNFRVNTFDIFEILRKEAVRVEINNVSATPKGVPPPPPSDDDGSMTSDLVIDAKRFSVPNHEKRFKEDWRWVRSP